MSDLISKSTIRSSYRSDHSILELDISIHKFKAGRGIWKFNNSLLKNKDYLDTVNKCIEEETIKYAVPTYNLDFLKNNFGNIEFIIEKEIFLEMLFMCIRGETIKFVTYLKKKNNKEDKRLSDDIELLESIQDPTGTNSKLLEDKRLKLQKLRENKVKGQMVRAHLQWLDQGEKPTTFFCKLETKNYVDKTIKRIQTPDGSIITEQSKMLQNVQELYSLLFDNKDNSLKSMATLKIPELQFLKKIDS